jgi:mRNA interferase RelE/StbE
MAKFALRVTARAQRGLDRLPASAAAAVAEFMVGALVDNPHRVGKPLHRELAELHSARRGPYRLVYRIDDEHLSVTVMRIEHRADVYR